MTFDYAGVKRWVRTDGLDAVTIDELGVVFTTFDTNPAVAASCIVAWLDFDEVADTAPRNMPKLWTAAATELRERRVPGTTTCLVIRVHGLGARADIDPDRWQLDGVAIPAPHYEGPEYAGEPRRLAENQPLAIVVAPGWHRLAGTIRLYDPGPRDLSFEATWEAPVGRSSIEITREGDALVATSR